MEKIAVVGAGLAGSLISVFLAKRGFQVDVYERRPDMRKIKQSAGRSINLALSTRGIKALHRAGVAEEILRHALPMHGRMMHEVDGALKYQPYGTEGQFINSISRKLLNVELVNLAEKFNQVHFHFEHKCSAIDFQAGKLTFATDLGEKTEVYDRIIGSDGAFSVLRMAMQTSGRFNFSQDYLPHGYKELTIPPKNGSPQMDLKSLHIWPRGEFMLIALPNPDFTFTCTLFLPFEGKESFNGLKEDQEIQQFFAHYFPDAMNLMPNLPKEFKENPTSSLVTVRCFPWVKDKVALMGDASHAIVPFYGQGMNSSFEDCVILDDMMEKYLPDWDKVFEAYQNERKPNAEAIADLALQNFLEMRDLVGDEKFLYQKKIEHKICSLYPNLFKSQYEMVTFSNQPYKEALHKGHKNTQLVQKIIQEKWEDKIHDKTFMTKLLNDEIV
ncbi:MAG: NAD(P)/FAD-dependent oxidoreductase [Bacteroidota bacterium]|nr:NAD(P)/FAD-dependent oxidoreductase [Bacteroidota bacterium]